MRLQQTAWQVGVGILSGAAIVLAVFISARGPEARLAAQVADRAQPRPPLVDEYYPVKHDWVGNDRAVITIKHRPTASCYVLVYPSGEQLMAVDADRCGTARPVER